MISFRTADLIDRVKKTIQYVGMPIRIVFSKKSGDTGVVTAQDAEKIHFKTPDGKDDWRYIANSDINIRNGRVYYIPNHDKNKYMGYTVINGSDGTRPIGKINDISEGFIYTDANKKIDSKGWGMTVADIHRTIRIDK